MRARLERDIERRAARRIAGATQRLYFGMWAPARLRPTAPDDGAVFDDHGAYCRVRPGAAERAPAQRQGQVHETEVIVLRQRRLWSARPGLSADAPSLAGDLGRLVGRQFGQRGFEILGFAEIAVHRGKAHISDVVEFAQMRHHGFADRLRGNLALAETLQLAHDLRHDLVDTFGLDRTLAQRDLHRAQQFVAVERHAPAVALDDNQLAQLHALEGGEAEIAGEANAAAADHRGILGRPRILHLGIEASATRTTHSCPRRFFPPFSPR